MKILVIIQIVVYAVNFLTDLTLGYGLSFYLYFIPGAIFQGQLWRLLTWLVIPNASNPFMLLLSCYFYYWIASTLERQWGTARFNLFYLSGVILMDIFAFIFCPTDIVIIGGYLIPPEIFSAFYSLTYREQEVIRSHLGFCPNCHSATSPKFRPQTFQEIAIQNELSSAQATENIYHTALRKMKDKLS